MKYWFTAIGWALICFSGGAFIFDIMRERDTNIAFLSGGLIGIILMVLGFVMKKIPNKQTFL